MWQICLNLIASLLHRGDSLKSSRLIIASRIREIGIISNPSGNNYDIHNRWGCGSVGDGMEILAIRKGNPYLSKKIKRKQQEQVRGGILLFFLSSGLYTMRDKKNQVIDLTIRVFLGEQVPGLHSLQVLGLRQKEGD